jgi:hypothetical protein
VLCPVLVRDIPILHMVLEELGFTLERVPAMLLSESMSRCERFTTPMKLSFSGYTCPVSVSSAYVPASIQSSFVRMPIVRRPWGSTDRASLSESEFARSTFAAETARITLALCE